MRMEKITSAERFGSDRSWRDKLSSFSGGHNCPVFPLVKRTSIQTHIAEREHYIHAPNSHSFTYICILSNVTGINFCRACNIRATSSSPVPDCQCVLCVRTGENTHTRACACIRAYAACCVQCAMLFAQHLQNPSHQMILRFVMSSLSPFHNSNQTNMLLYGEYKRMFVTFRWMSLFIPRTMTRQNARHKQQVVEKRPKKTYKMEQENRKKKERLYRRAYAQMPAKLRKYQIGR